MQEISFRKYLLDNLDFSSVFCGNNQVRTKLSSIDFQIDKWNIFDIAGVPMILVAYKNDFPEDAKISESETLEKCKSITTESQNATIVKNLNDEIEQTEKEN